MPDWYWPRACSISVFNVTQQLKIDTHHIVYQTKYPAVELMELGILLMLKTLCALSFLARTRVMY